MLKGSLKVIEPWQMELLLELGDVDEELLDHEEHEEDDEERE